MRFNYLYVGSSPIGNATKANMIKSKHTLSYCPGCRTEMVRCGTCNNNCCNGGSGQIDGNVCPDCDDAYDAQTMHHNEPGSVEFAKVDDLDTLKKTKSYMDEFFEKFVDLEAEMDSRLLN